MRAFSILLTIFAITSTAHAQNVFQCVDGGQVFTVSKKYDGTYNARLVNLYGVSYYGNCQRDGRRTVFRCYSNDATATVTRSGVQIELDAEVGPYNSNIVTSLRCR